MVAKVLLSAVDDHTIDRPFLQRRHSWMFRDKADKNTRSEECRSNQVINSRQQKNLFCSGAIKLRT